MQENPMINSTTAVDVLMDGLQNRDRSVRERAAVFLAKRGDAAAIPVLMEMLEEDWEAQCELFRLLRADARSPDDFASWLQQVIAGYRTRRGSMGLYALAVAQSPEMSDRIDGQRDRLIAALGESFPALVLDEHSSMEKRVDGQLMVIQIEHVCLMATRESQESAVEAGIDLVSRRMAAFVART